MVQGVMFLLQVIISTYYLCQSSDSRSIYSDDASDLGSGVLFSWKLSKDTLKMSVKLPDLFRWIAVGFHRIPFVHKSWEDIALITIEEQLGGQVSFLKTIHIDEDKNVGESRLELYKWVKRGRRKSKGFYYFTIKRMIEFLPTDSPVELVWAYGKEIGFKEYPDANLFTYASLILNEPDLLKKQKQVSVNTTPQTGHSVNRQRNEELNNNPADMEKESPNENIDTVSKQTDDSDKSMKKVETQNGDTVVNSVGQNKDSEVVNRTGVASNESSEHPQDVTSGLSKPRSEQDNESLTQLKTSEKEPKSQSADPVTSESVTTESLSEKNKQSGELPEPVDVQVVSEITETAVDHLESNTTTGEGEWRAKSGSRTVNPLTPAEIIATVTEATVSENEVKTESKDVNSITKTESLSADTEVKGEEVETPDGVPLQDEQSSGNVRTPVPTFEEHRKCAINPCSYSQCPHGTKCFPNYEHCTSICTKSENGTETAATTKCNCVQQKQSWYDVFKNNENTVYFGVIGFSAFFTGLIVLCLACCCARKARKLPRTRRKKVAFYKVDDFDSSADEEIEFLKEDGDVDDDMKLYNNKGVN